jgi:hypothetical protein
MKFLNQYEKYNNKKKTKIKRECSFSSDQILIQIILREREQAND